jgi:hypothetical protein
MYFDFKDTTFNEIALLVPLDLLNITSDGNIIYKYSTSKESETLTLKNTFSIEPPLNFKHLTLLQPNQFYKNPDLYTNKTITLNPINGVEFFYKENSPLKCEKFMQHKKVNSIRQCDAQCDENYMIYPGINKNEGYCDHICTNAMNCENFDDDYCKEGYYNL